LNYACSQTQIVEELNLLLRDERNKKAGESTDGPVRNPEDSKEKEAVKDDKKVEKKNFILSCIVFVDPVTK